MVIFCTLHYLKYGVNKNKINEILFLLTQPVLFIASCEAGTRWQSKNVYNRASSPKDIFIVEGANHFDIYDKEPYVSQALDKIYSYIKQVQKQL